METLILIDERPYLIPGPLSLTEAIRHIGALLNIHRDNPHLSRIRIYALC
jgi:hypothetical protein